MSLIVSSVLILSSALALEFFPNYINSKLRPVCRAQLKPMLEAAALLVMDKAVFAKPQVVRRQFIELSGPQLRALLFNFRPDAYALLDALHSSNM